MAKLNRDAKIGLLYVVIAVFFFSTSPIFIRWADSVSSYELTFWRLTTAALTVGVMMLIKREHWHMPRRDLRKFALFGLITALHFLFYIASLYFTTIAHSLAIVYTAPIFVTIFSAIFLKEHIPKRKWGGILITVIGIAILVLVTLISVLKLQPFISFLVVSLGLGLAGSLSTEQTISAMQKGIALSKYSAFVYC